MSNNPNIHPDLSHPPVRYYFLGLRLDLALYKSLENINQFVITGPTSQHIIQFATDLNNIKRNTNQLDTCWPKRFFLT